MRSILILLGAPGAGKGTQAERLCARIGLPHVATGDLFRENLNQGTELGQRARAFMDRGALVPDEVVVDMLRERVSHSDCAQGYLLDGFPRTRPQAEALDELAAAQEGKVRALLLEVPDGILLERLTGRRVCGRDSSHIHHLRFSPPRVAGICDTCGGELVQRPDDQADVVSHRLEVYRRETAPVIDFYSARGDLERLDGNRSPEQVLPDIVRWAQQGAA
jgi:adenylate kinase